MYFCWAEKVKTCLFSLVKMFRCSSPQPSLNNSSDVPSVKFLTGSPSVLLQYTVAKPFIFFLVSRFHKIRQYYEKISTSVQVATHTCRQQNSNFHPVLGESLLRLILLLYFFFQSLMLTVDKELSSRKFKLNVFKSDYYTQFTVYLFRFWKCFIKYILFFHIPHSGHQSFKVLFRPNGNSTWLSYFPPLILFIISTQKLDCEQSLIFLLSHSGPIAQSTREGRDASGEAARIGTRVI